MTERLGAIILAGGQSTRMGRDKALLPWKGRRAIDAVFDLARAVGCTETIVAGRHYGYPFVCDPLHAPGPAVALLHAIETIAWIDRFLVLTVDAPGILPSDLERLLAHGDAGACYRDQPAPLQLHRSAAARASGCRSLRSVVMLGGVAELTPPPNAESRLRGANTPEEYVAAGAELPAAALGDGSFDRTSSIRRSHGGTYC